MTDLPSADLYRRGRPQELRTASGPPSEVVEVPRALRGLLKPDPSPPAHPANERPAMNHDEVRRQLESLERVRQAGLAQAFTDAVGCLFEPDHDPLADMFDTNTTEETP